MVKNISTSENTECGSCKDTGIDNDGAYCSCESGVRQVDRYWETLWRVSDAMYDRLVGTPIIEGSDDE